MYPDSINIKVLLVHTGVVGGFTGTGPLSSQAEAHTPAVQRWKRSPRDRVPGRNLIHIVKGSVQHFLVAVKNINHKNIMTKYNLCAFLECKHNSMFPIEGAVAKW